MTETREFIHLLRNIPNAILFVNPLQKMRARVTRDGTKCAHLMAISIFRLNQIHPWKKYPVTVYYPDLYILLVIVDTTAAPALYIVGQ